MANVPARLSCSILFAMVLSCSSCTLMPGYTSASDMAAENLAIADGYADLSKYDKAMPYYRKAERVRLYRNAARWGLARACAMTGDWPTAQEILEGLYLQDPANRMVTEAYAFAMLKTGDTEKGLGLYGALRDSLPDDAVAAVNYAEVLCLAERWEEALTAAQKARDDYPDTEAIARLDAIERECQKKLAEQEPEGDSPPDAVQPADLKQPVPAAE